MRRLRARMPEVIGTTYTEIEANARREAAKLFDLPPGVGADAIDISIVDVVVSESDVTKGDTNVVAWTVRAWSAEVIATWDAHEEK